MTDQDIKILIETVSAAANYLPEERLDEVIRLQQELCDVLVQRRVLAAISDLEIVASNTADLRAARRLNRAIGTLRIVAANTGGSQLEEDGWDERWDGAPSTTRTALN